MSTEAVIDSPKTTCLRVPREQALPALRTCLERGLELKMLRVRGASDLERAREQKLDWTGQTNNLLKVVFDNDEIPQEFNAWIGKVLPEYADLSQFIEQFYDEMEQRLRRLHAIMRRVESEPDVMPRPLSAPSATVSAKEEKVMSSVSTPVAEPAAAPAPVQAAIPAPAPAAPAAPQPARAATATPSAAQANRVPRCCVMIVRTRNEQLEEALNQFVGKLNFEMNLLFEQSDGSRGLISKLEKLPRITFAMVLASAEDVAAAREAGSSPGGRAAFEIGFCAGKLGFSRVVVIHNAPHPMFHDDFGMAYIPIDPADGWQLQMARHLKKAGIEVDLNRLC